MGIVTLLVVMLVMAGTGSLDAAPTKLVYSTPSADKTYDGSPLVRVANADENGFLSAASMAGKDSMEISVFGNTSGDRMILVARYDNLGKGASGAAVECLNILLGADPTANLVV